MVRAWCLARAICAGEGRACSPVPLDQLQSFLAEKASIPPNMIEVKGRLATSAKCFPLLSSSPQARMSTLVLPGQPLSAPSTTPFLAGPGTFQRGGTIFASLIGHVSRDGGVRPFSLYVLRVLTACRRSSAYKERTTRKLSPSPTAPFVSSLLPPSSAQSAQVIGTITRITRQAATLSLLTVDGRPCRPDFVGVIRSQDVRMTAKDTVKIWGCFRPGDVVRAKVVRAFSLSCRAS